MARNTRKSRERGVIDTPLAIFLKKVLALIVIQINKASRHALAPHPAPHSMSPRRDLVANNRIIDVEAPRPVAVCIRQYQRKRIAASET
ncbi:hypothetical protein [Candidatus Binatus sp.]|uniref:hypothetical protein n=1 Tax=Candidatus Binatus sp. TaxID=2811406 RepID=UPI003BB0ED8B